MAKKLVCVTNSLFLHKYSCQPMKNSFTKNGTILFLIMAAAFSRLLPHPVNFTAIGALAIYSASVVPNKFYAGMLPLVAMWISDLVINNVIYASYQNHFVFFSEGWYWIYFGILAHNVSVWLLAKNRSIGSLAGASALGAIFFFLFSNFGVWYSTHMYPPTFEGLIVCYWAALPFFGNFLAANLFYAAILFGVHTLLEKNTKFFQAVA